MSQPMCSQLEVWLSFLKIYILYGRTLLVSHALTFYIFIQQLFVFGNFKARVSKTGQSISSGTDLPLPVGRRPVPPSPKGGPFSFACPSAESSAEGMLRPGMCSEVAYRCNLPLIILRTRQPQMRRITCAQRRNLTAQVDSNR